MMLVEDLCQHTPIRKACDALGVPRSSYYRWLNPPPRQSTPPRPVSPRALDATERKRVVAALDSERFIDMAPHEVFATLLDEGTYFCSIRTMYRVLAENAQVRERRDQLIHPAHKRPELVARGPNEVWSWDITKLHGPQKGVFYSLYVILDIFSRFVVGWMVAFREAAELAEDFIRQTMKKQKIVAGQLTIHADRGAPMTSKSVSEMMSDLGVLRSHSRPRTSNDNPYSESHFKTMKYRPDFPSRFGSIEDARSYGGPFFRWYNSKHHHTGIALLTPADVHYGRADEVQAKRQATLLKAYRDHPERFPNGSPKPLVLPDAVWINPPLTGVDK